MSRDGEHRLGHIVPMVRRTKLSPPKSAKGSILRDRLIAARNAAQPKLSQANMAKLLSDAAGETVELEAYKKYEQRNGIPRHLATAAGRILGVDPLYLIDADRPEIDLSHHGRRSIIDREAIKPVIVRGTLQAGLFREANELPPDEWETAYMPASHPYAQKALEGFRISGDSMDEFYPHGTWVVVCPSIYLGEGWLPEPGQHVVVHRINEWSEIEATVKEVAFDGDDLLLIPRSRNPAFQKPWRLSPQPADRDAHHDRIRLAGRVVYSGRTAPGIW